MRKWIELVAVLSVIGIQGMTNVNAADTPKQSNAAASKLFVEIAEKVLNYQIGLEKELHRAAVESCKGCDTEAEVCGFEYDDVTAILETALANDPKSADAAFLLGRVYWMKSYVGEGSYSQEYLSSAKKNLELARKLGISQRYASKLKYYLSDTERALTGRYEPRKCE